MNENSKSGPEQEATVQQTAPAEQKKNEAVSEQPQAEEAMRAELDALRREKRDRELCEDESMGELYRMLREEVRDLVDFSQQQGIRIDPEDAFHALLVQNFTKLIAQAERRGEDRALQSLTQISAASPMALGGSQPQPVTDYGKMDDAAFDRLVKRALRGELRRGVSL